MRAHGIEPGADVPDGRWDAGGDGISLSHHHASISSRLPTYVSGSKVPGSRVGRPTVGAGPRAQPANPMTVSAKAPCPRSRRNIRRLMSRVDPGMPAM